MASFEGPGGEPGPAAADSSDDEGMYRVERILKSKVVRGRTLYLVRWEGYGEEDDSWEDEANINEAALRDFEDRQARARRG